MRASNSATGTVANLTASRVSTERVRKMRFFQEHEYISLDFTRQDVLRVRVAERQPARSRKINFEKLPTTPVEPLAGRAARIPRFRPHAQRFRAVDGARRSPGP